MQALTLNAAHGWRWLAEGFRIFRKNHLMLTFLVVSYWMLMAIVNVIPMIGTIATTLCIPAFSVSLMNACRNIDKGGPLGPRTLFSGFQENPRALITLGAIYLAATVGILAISSLADGGALMQLMLAGHTPNAEVLASGDVMLALQVALILLCPLIMAYWYAPILAAWHGLSPAKALFFSFIACARNWRAFLVYSLALLVAATLLPGLLLGTLAERADIFISYRRADTGMAAGRLRDELIEHFGSRRVFMDLHGIDPSADWRETIGAAIAACKVGVVLIGQGFMAADAQGRPRLYDEGDVLRFELESLLASHKRILPVLVDDAQLPAEDALPEGLRPLLRYQAPRINNANWQAVSAAVVGACEAVLRPVPA